MFVFVLFGFKYNKKKKRINKVCKDVENISNFNTTTINFIHVPCFKHTNGIQSPSSFKTEAER